MFMWLTDTVSSCTWRECILGVLGGVASCVIGMVLACYFLVKLPNTYFLDSHPPAFVFEVRHPALRYCFLAGKNIFGVLVIVVGIVLSLPGVPGPGFLTIFIGLTLVNFPGKRALEQKLVRQPIILARINRLRARFGRPALEVSEPVGKVARPS